MKKPSRTAELVAMHRALELRRPENERICNDPYAAHFPSRAMIRRGESWIIREIFGGFMIHFVFPGINGALVARVRYFDDYLKACIAGGLEQLVIWGAGYDSRAYRFDEIRKNVKTFEVDYPGTQERKKEKLKKIFGAVPGHVVYVPIYPDRERPDQLLYQNGYDRSLKTLFVLEGVSMYMPPDDIENLFSFIAGNSGRGSSVIFDTLDRRVVNGTGESREGKSLFLYLGLSGETLRFGIAPGDIDDFLSNRGFSDIKIVDGELCKNLYFKGKNKNRKVSGIFRFVNASVR